MISDNKKFKTKASITVVDDDFRQQENQIQSPKSRNTYWNLNKIQNDA